MRRCSMPVIVVGLAFLIGCAAFKQAKADYDVGKSTPVEEREVTPLQSAHSLIDPLTPFLPVPFQPIAGVLIGGLTLFGTWQRGRRIRKTLPVSANPITGSWGQKIGLETIVQQVAATAQGLFEVGPENSGLRRAWKVVMAVILTILALPPLQTFLLAHPAQLGTFTAVLAGIAGLEKELSRVLPIQTPPTS